MALRAAIVGWGVRGPEHAEAIAAVDDLDVVAVVEPDPAVRARVTDVPAYASLAEVPDADALDVVVVATPAAGRGAVVDEVLEHTGTRAIVAEKPLELELDAATAIVEACAAAGVLLAVSHQSRCAPQFGRLRDAVRDGRIGRLERLHVTSFGNVLDQGSHMLDLIRWVAGTPVEWVMSSSEDDPAVLSGLAPADLGWWRDPDHPAPAFITCHLGLGGGVRATMESGLLYQRARDGVDDWRQRRIVAVGTDGMAEASVTGRLRVTSTRGLLEEMPDDPAAPIAATTALHRDVVRALRSGTAIVADGAEAVATLEVVLACVQSAATGRLVTLPIGTPHAPPPTGPRAAVPSISVVLNLHDHRDVTPDAIASWRLAQGFAGRVELVAASNGTSPELDAVVRAMLAPTDQLIVVAGAPRIGLYDAGVRAATGDIVVITEAHCTAEPGCLGALAAALEDPRATAAAGSAVAMGGNAFERLDAEVFERGVATYGAPSDWRRVVPHAFAIRRDAYVQLGGFDVRHDLFAQQELAAGLRRAGMAIVDAPAARVRHRFADEPHEALHTMEGFARGQAIARTEAPGDAFDRRLFPLGGLDAVEADRHVATRAAIGAITARATITDAGRWLWPALLPPRALERTDAMRLGAAIARCRLWRSGPRLERAYLDMNDVATRRARRQVLVEVGPPRLDAIDGSGRWAVADLAPSQLSGAHDVENYERDLFSWLTPAAALRTDLPPGAWHVVLHTGGFGRDPRAANVRVRVDGRPLPSGSVVVDERSLSIVVPPRRLRAGRPQCWVIATDVMAPAAGSADERRLGLPLVAVEVRPR